MANTQIGPTTGVSYQISGRTNSDVFLFQFDDTTPEPAILALASALPNYSVLTDVRLIKVTDANTQIVVDLEPEHPTFDPPSGS